MRPKLQNKATFEVICDTSGKIKSIFYGSKFGNKKYEHLLNHCNISKSYKEYPDEIIS